MFESSTSLILENLREFAESGQILGLPKVTRCKYKPKQMTQTQFWTRNEICATQNNLIQLLNFIIEINV